MLSVNISRNAAFTSSPERFPFSVWHSKSLTEHIRPRNSSLSSDNGCECMNGFGSVVAMTWAWNGIDASVCEGQSGCCAGTRVLKKVRIVWVVGEIRPRTWIRHGTRCVLVLRDNIQPFECSWTAISIMYDLTITAMLARTGQGRHNWIPVVFLGYWCLNLHSKILCSCFQRQIPSHRLVLNAGFINEMHPYFYHYGYSCLFKNCTSSDSSSRIFIVKNFVSWLSLVWKE